MTRIAIGSDHAGFRAKEALKGVLESIGVRIVDVGTLKEEPVDYPDYARKVGTLVAGGEVERGILICGTGIGMSIAANKVRGIRAAAVDDLETARLSRAHNDANVLCLGSRVTNLEQMKRILSVWLETPFEGGRHKRRIDKIHRLERTPQPPPGEGGSPTRSSSPGNSGVTGKVRGAGGRPARAGPRSC